jgi:predicted helicase
MTQIGMTTLRYIVWLIGKVITVSLETMKIVKSLSDLE